MATRNTAAAVPSSASPKSQPSVPLDQSLMDAWKARHRRKDELRAMRFRRYVLPPALAAVVAVIWLIASRT